MRKPIHQTEQHLENSSISDSIGSPFDIPILPNATDPRKRGVPPKNATQKETREKDVAKRIRYYVTCKSPSN